MTVYMFIIWVVFSNSTPVKSCHVNAESMRQNLFYVLTDAVKVHLKTLDT